MKRILKQEYTVEFKDQAVKRAQEVGVGVAARDLGLVGQTLRNWFKAAAAGKLNGPGAKLITPEQREVSRLRAENLKLRMHVDILKSGGVLLQGCSVKYAWIETRRSHYPRVDRCEVLAVSASGYRVWRRGGTPDSARVSDVQAVVLIRVSTGSSRRPTARDACTASCKAGGIAWVWNGSSG